MLKENHKYAASIELIFWDYAYLMIRLVQRSKIRIEKINFKPYLTAHLMLAVMSGLFIGFIMGIVLGY